MLNKILLSGALALCFNFSNAQTDEVKVKKKNHYIGVQANQLFRQVLSLSSNASENTNPYLLTYTMNSIKSGWGMDVAAGYTYATISNKGTPTSTTSDINDLFARIGFGRKVMIGKKFQAGYHFDLVNDLLNNKTTSEQTNTSNGFTQKQTTETTTKTLALGGGPRLTLAFHITDRILLGTESNYYAKYVMEKEHLFVNSTSTNSNGFQNSFSTNSNNDSNSLMFTMGLPVAFFLTIKL